MKNKLNTAKNKVIRLVKEKIFSYIWNMAVYDGIRISEHDIAIVCQGNLVMGVMVGEMIAINNLKEAWEFILNYDREYNYDLLCQLHKIICNKLLTDEYLGIIRKIPISMNRMKRNLSIPTQKQVEDKLNQLLKQNNKSKVEIAIEVMLWLMHNQIFVDGNDKVAILFANKIMIDNGCGVISIVPEKQSIFEQMLIKYYESGDMSQLKQWIYDNGVISIMT